ncbi:MAG: hypothetical protein JJU46_05380 [Balneolaceae bacterium]|nr:hypothetical protein [Balneolaceae bacterium]MCH8548425.1 hypothetical protein [Balneolaceae bacterium]
MGNKAVNIIIILLLVLFISFRLSIACDELNRERPAELPESEEITDLPLSFTGTVPCEGCPDTEIHFHLDQNRYELLEWDLADELPSEPERGYWVLSGDTLTTYSEDLEISNRFIFSEDQINPIDRYEGLRLYVNHEESSIRKRHNEFRDEGVDFLASGNEPFWSVQIRFGNSVVVRTPEDEWEAGAPDSEDDGYLTTYSASDGSKTFEISSAEDFCRDSMSGFLFTHTVTLRIDGGSEMRGCGRFLNQ